MRFVTVLSSKLKLHKRNDTMLENNAYVFPGDIFNNDGQFLPVLSDCSGIIIGSTQPN